MIRKALIAAAALATVALAACDDTRVITTPDATPTATVPNPATMPETKTGGPCGDGKVLRPGEHCP